MTTPVSHRHRRSSAELAQGPVANNQRTNPATVYALPAIGAAAVPQWRGPSRSNNLRCLAGAAGLLRLNRSAARARRVTLRHGGGGVLSWEGGRGGRTAFPP